VIRFYTTLGCHLCEDAWALLAAWLAEHAPGTEVAGIEISDDPELVSRYGIRIPVVSVGEDELECPFGAAELDTFLSPRLRR
tara:strand:+ start:2237 stop:2482 length:246 start_codon:yes stop_codon:yes gene_type:complete